MLEVVDVVLTLDLCQHTITMSSIRSYFPLPNCDNEEIKGQISMFIAVVNSTNILWAHLRRYSCAKKKFKPSKALKASSETFLQKSSAKNVVEIDTCCWQKLFYFNKICVIVERKEERLSDFIDNVFIFLFVSKTTNSSWCQSRNKLQLIIFISLSLPASLPPSAKNKYNF